MEGVLIVSIGICSVLLIVSVVAIFGTSKVGIGDLRFE